jgi:hypothetical protein
MDDWAWEQLQPWLRERHELPVGPLLCIATGRRVTRVPMRALAFAEEMPEEVPTYPGQCEFAARRLRADEPGGGAI